MSDLDAKSEQLKKTEERLNGRNLRKDEVKEFVKEFTVVVKGIRINGKPFANSINRKGIGTNPELTIEEMQHVLDIKDKSKVDFIRQIYIRAGFSIIKKLYPDETIVNLPTISFQENGNEITINY